MSMTANFLASWIQGRSTFSGALVMRYVALAIGAALLLTLGSSLFPRSRLEVQDWDCPPVPASCARPVVVAGYPVPYMSDYHGISPVGRVTLSGALLGEDHFHPVAFGVDLAVYAMAVAGVLAAGRASARRRLGGVWRQ